MEGFLTMLDDFIDQDYFGDYPDISNIKREALAGNALFDSADLLILANEFAWRMEEAAMALGG